MLELNLSGRVALVTGGSEGIGKGIARKLAQEGCRVAVCARRRDVLADAARAIRSESGAEVLAVPADVTQAADLERLVNAAVSEFGGIDILVNNAGRSEGHHFEDAAESVWLSDFDLKFWAAVRSSKLAVPHMKARGGGSIVNITHPGGKAPGPGSVPTSVSRAAGIALTKAMVQGSGATSDPREHGMPDEHPVRSGAAGVDGVRQRPGFRCLVRGTRKGRPPGPDGEPGEVADLVAFLVSDRGAFITGAAINIDGGEGATV